uniref:Malate dehydrogenase, mitochondrial n=1 Tax=Glossina brevipalpis TaxID=37001 RepID=A0A1A9X224_9MUSC
MQKKKDVIKETSKSCDVVVVPAGVPHEPGLSRDDLFKVNVDTVKVIAQVVAAKCPKILVAIITNPVNSCVPIAAEIMKKDGAYDPKRLFGVSTLDIVRDRTFIGEVNGVDPKEVEIPVIGGHSGITIIPVLSQSKPAFKGDQAAIETMTMRIQEAGTEVVKAKAGEYGEYRLQKSTVEESEDMKSITEYHLSVYKSYQNRYLDCIIYYRNGVSDVQFPKIKKDELIFLL